VFVRLRDREGRPLSGLAVTGRLQRPATETGARTLAFAERAPGDYAAPAQGVSGAWDLTLQAEGSGAVRFEAERRLSWP